MMLLTIKVDLSSAAKLYQIIRRYSRTEGAGGRSQVSERPEAIENVMSLTNNLHWWPYLCSTHHQVSVRLSSNTASYSLVTPDSTIHCSKWLCKVILPTQYHSSSKNVQPISGDWSESWTFPDQRYCLRRLKSFFPLSKWSCMHMTSSLITCRLVVTNPSCRIS